MQNTSSYSGSQSQASTGYGLSQWLASHYGRFQAQHGINQLGSVPGLTLIQPTFDSAMSSDLTSIPYTGSPGQGAMVYMLPQWLANQYGSSQPQRGVNQLGSVPVTQPASDSAVSSGSTSSSYSGSPSQGSMIYGLPQWLANQYGSSQPQHGVNQLAPVPVTQPASDSAVSSGSTSSSYSGSQSQGLTGNGLPQRLANHYGSSQPQHGVNQLGSVPVTQPASDSAVSSGSTSSSYNGSPSQGSIHYGLSPWPVNCYGRLETLQNENQLSSVPVVTETQPFAESGMSSSPTSGISNSAPTGSRAPFTWLSLGLSSQPVGSWAQQGINQLGLVPVMQPASDSAMSRGFQQANESAQAAIGSSPSSLPSTYAGSQSQSSTTDWQSLGLSKPYVGPQVQQSVSGPSSAPASMIQSASDSAVSSGSTSSFYSGFQSQGLIYGLPQWLASKYDSSQPQHGVNQLGSVPLIQPASSSAVPSGSTLSSYSGSQSQGSTVYGLSQVPASPDGNGRFQMQQGINWLSAESTVTQQATEGTSTTNATSNLPSSYAGSQNPSPATDLQSPGLSKPYVGSQVQQNASEQSSGSASEIQPASNSAVSSGSTSSSYSGSQSQASTVYGLSQVPASPDGSGRFQMQQGINWPSTASTVTQQATQNAPAAIGSSSSSLPTSYAVSPSPTTAWQLPGLSKPHVGSQVQQSVSRWSSASAIQPASDSAVSSGSPSSSNNGSPSQSSMIYRLPQWLANQYGSSQPQHSVNQLGSVPLIQPASNSAVSSGSTSSSYSGPQSQGSTVYELSQGPASPDGNGRFRTQQGINWPSAASTVTQQATAGTLTTNATSTSNLPSSYAGSQSPSPATDWQSPGISKPYVGSQVQQSASEQSSAPAFAIQPSSDGALSSGSPSQGSIDYGWSPWPVNCYGSLQTLPNESQLRAVPAVRVTQQVSQSGMSSGPSTSDISSHSYSGSQSPSLSQAAGNYLGMQNQNIQKLGAVNLQDPVLWMGRFFCENVFSGSSSNSSKLS